MHWLPSNCALVHSINLLKTVYDGTTRFILALNGSKEANRQVDLITGGWIAMNLSIRYIYHKILKKDANAYIADEHAVPLKIQWISIASPRFASHAGFLYFVEEEYELPTLMHKAEGGFGCIVPERLSDLCKGIPRIIIDDETDPDSLFEYLVTEVEKYRTWHDNINELLVSDASYLEILDETSQFVPRPMYIADANWRMVSHIAYEMNEISATWHYQMLHDGWYPISVVEALNRTGEFQRITNLPRAALLESEVFTMKIIAKPLRYRNQLVGYFFIIDTHNDLGYCETEIAEELGKMLLPLVASRNTLSGITNSQNNFIAQVIGGHITSKQKIATKLMEETHWPLRSDFTIVTVKFAQDELNNHMLHMRVVGLLESKHDSHAFYYKDRAIVVFRTQGVDDDEFREHLNRCCTSLRRVLVVSKRFLSFDQLPEHYGQNLLIEEMIESDPTPRVVSCDAMLPKLLADFCYSKVPLCYEVDVLNEYDKKNNTAFCETLFFYLSYERNIAAVSKAMFLHRNTLRNRLTRIQEIVPIDLDDPMTRFRLIISLNTLMNS